MEGMPQGEPTQEISLADLTAEQVRERVALHLGELSTLPLRAPEDDPEARIVSTAVRDLEALADARLLDTRSALIDKLGPVVHPSAPTRQFIAAALALEMAMRPVELPPEPAPAPHRSLWYRLTHRNG